MKYIMAMANTEENGVKTKSFNRKLAATIYGDRRRKKSKSLSPVLGRSVSSITRWPSSENLQTFKIKINL